MLDHAPRLPASRKRFSLSATVLSFLLTPLAFPQATATLPPPFPNGNPQPAGHALPMK